MPTDIDEEAISWRDISQDIDKNDCEDIIIFFDETKNCKGAEDNENDGDDEEIGDDTEVVNKILTMGSDGKGSNNGSSSNDSNGSGDFSSGNGSSSRPGVVLHSVSTMGKSTQDPNSPARTTGNVSKVRAVSPPPTASATNTNPTNPNISTNSNPKGTTTLHSSGAPYVTTATPWNIRSRANAHGHQVASPNWNSFPIDADKKYPCDTYSFIALYGPKKNGKWPHEKIFFFLFGLLPFIFHLWLS